MPYPTPALTGCAIAVTKQYFYHLGGFDPGLEIWGGEHFELAFRTWMCGGAVEVVPCSIVGHLYKLLTHDFLGDVDTIRDKNNLQVAEIWMDEYKDFIYASYRSERKIPTFTQKELKSIEARKELRQRLKCGSFKNYLEMFPELKIPTKDSIYYGAVKNSNTSYCLVVQPNGNVGVGDNRCGDWRLLPEEQFIIDRKGRLMFEELCVGMDGNTTLLRASKINCDDSTSLWTWNTNKGGYRGLLELSGPTGRYCMVHHQGDMGTQKQDVVELTSCNNTASNQLWSIAHEFDFGDSP
ncbi:polypeptide N-acetylgalactosaminyltransferase 5-like [Haliotis rubra]|uniref:polypeptide N-acetylgalactosaminyltransferase 5-like n=1 Tax=Haliotis rubra TaxID=36100 RepID=UPI001EE5E490|nr:polypeptide N-acetylgalactosaminyltransferase 5-like [Haliotis rubra]